MTPSTPCATTPSAKWPTRLWPRYANRRVPSRRHSGPALRARTLQFRTKGKLAGSLAATAAAIALRVFVAAASAAGAFTSTRSARLVCMAVAATSSVASHVRKQHLKGLKSSPGAPPSLAASASPPWLRAWSTRTCPPWSAVRSRARSTCARWGSGAAGVGSRRKPAIADSAAPSAPRSSSRARPVDSVRSVFGRRSAHSRTHVQRTLRDQNYALKAATARTE
mmetsp:Transcript_275/g.639  ORF Transcript_275/g.639 Transcript_275/m.639 type:complete len:223 (-) Transcript_275:85-753(-)